MSEDHYPPGWNKDRGRRVLQHHEQQSDEEAVAEDEATYEDTQVTTMGVPVELVPTVRDLVAKGGSGDGG